MKVVAVIPVFNEQNTIAEVIEKTRKYVDLVIVVDDKSTDRSVDRMDGACVVRNTTPYKGAGIATSLGIKKALEHDADIVVTLDGDMQHDPAYIPALLQEQRKFDYTKADVVLGMRDITRDGVPFLRWLGNGIFRFMVNVGNRVYIRDSECGFRAFSAEVLREIQIESMAFGFCDEMVIKARSLGYSIAQVPIKTYYGAEQKKYSFFPAMKRGLEIPYLILKWRWIYEWSHR